MPTTRAGFDLPPRAADITPPPARHQRGPRPALEIKEDAATALSAAAAKITRSAANSLPGWASGPGGELTQSYRYRRRTLYSGRVAAVGWAACRAEGGAHYRPSVCLCVCLSARWQSTVSL